MGSSCTTLPEEVIPSMVWLATCPRLSPVMMHCAPVWRHSRSAMRIMKRRSSVIIISAGQYLWIASWMWVTLITCRSSPPV